MSIEKKAESFDFSADPTAKGMGAGVTTISLKFFCTKGSLEWQVFPSSSHVE